MRSAYLEGVKTPEQNCSLPEARYCLLVQTWLEHTNPRTRYTLALPFSPTPFTTTSPLLSQLLLLGGKKINMSSPPSLLNSSHWQ